MLIHSVTSPHMLIEQPDIPQTTYKKFSGGYIEGCDTPGGFQISRLHSTDLALYLKNEYAPGRVEMGGSRNHKGENPL